MSTATWDENVRECLAWIDRQQSVTFVELAGWLAERGYAVKGDYAFEMQTNVILWAGMSREFLEFVAKGLGPSIDVWRSSVFVYAYDGGLLNMPVARRPPKLGYRSPHWLPVTLRVRGRESPDDKECRVRCRLSPPIQGPQHV